MRKQIRQKYIEGNKKEDKRFFELKEHPKISQYYSSRVSPSQKHISTEIYKESYQLPKNIQRKNEFYNYAEFTPYSQHNHNSSEKNFFSKNETYYTSSKKNMNNNFNFNYNEDRGGMYTTFKKRAIIFGNTDLRNEYSPLADARVNIRKKLIEERDVNYQTDAQGNLLENFKYYEINNSRNNSAQKYDSITRIVGYSNLIPLHTRKMVKNYSNVNINKNGNYSKKIEHNYIIKKDVNIVQQNQKKEFKKPAQLDTTKKTEIIKKYEIKKQPEIKKVEENKYKKYERKKEETVKKEVKQEVKKETKKTEIKAKEIKKEVKKDYKEPIIIKRKENIKATFSPHSGRYNYKGNISNDIINSRKNYNANSTEKNVKKVEIVQKSSKSEKKVENKNKINTVSKIQTTIKKKEEPKPTVKKSEVVKKEVKKITTNVKPIEKKEITNTVKKINITENNYRKKEEIKKIDNTPKKINYSKNINIKTESYGKIDENKYRRENIDISNMINIKEINRIYEMKRNRNTTPKLKTKKINLGDNYKFYERKYMQSPDDNYFTIHQRRNQRVIYGEQIIESNGVRKMKMYKSKPYIMEERYNSQIINNSRNPCLRGENENYIMSSKYYENNYTNGNRSKLYDDEDGMYYSEQGGSYYY